MLYSIEIGLTQHSGVSKGLCLHLRELTAILADFAVLSTLLCSAVSPIVVKDAGSDSHLNRSHFCVSSENQGFSRS